MDHVLPAIIVLVGGDGRHPQVWNPAVLDIETVLGVISLHHHFWVMSQRQWRDVETAVKDCHVMFWIIGGVKF